MAVISLRGKLNRQKNNNSEKFRAESSVLLIFYIKNKDDVPTDTHLQAVADELNKNLPKLKLDTVVRRAHFFGQIKRESSDLAASQKI